MTSHLDVTRTFSEPALSTVTSNRNALILARAAFHLRSARTVVAEQVLSLFAVRSWDGRGSLAVIFITTLVHHDMHSIALRECCERLGECRDERL